MAQNNATIYTLWAEDGPYSISKYVSDIRMELGLKGTAVRLWCPPSRLTQSLRSTFWLYKTFEILFSIGIPFHIFFTRPPVCIVYSQLFWGALLFRIVKRMFGTRLHLVIVFQDIHPEAYRLDRSFYLPRYISVVIKKFVDELANSADSLVTISPQMKSVLLRRFPKSSVQMIENWHDLGGQFPRPQFRNGVLPLRLLFAGTAGPTIDASMFDNHKLVPGSAFEGAELYFAGGGKGRSRLMSSLKLLGCKIIDEGFLCDLMFENRLRSVSFAIIPTYSDSFSYSFPSRIYTYISYGVCPIVLGHADTVTESRYVTFVPPPILFQLSQEGFRDLYDSWRDGLEGFSPRNHRLHQLSGYHRMINRCQI